jgi:hypothetical protein
MPTEQEDNGFLPQTRTVSAEQEGAAVTKSLTDEQAKANFKRRLEALDINDPGAAVDPAPEEKPVTPAKPEATPSVPRTADSGPAFAPELLARAREHGITAHEAKEYGDPKHLERALAHFDRSLAQRQPAAPQQQAAPVEEEPSLPDLPDPSEDGSEWDPKLLQWAKQTRETFDRQRAENKQLNSKLDQVNQHLQRQEIERVTAQWDGFFENVPAEFKAAVGEGSIYDIDRTEAGDTRRRVLAVALGIQDSLQKMGQRVPSFKTLAEQALRAVVTPTTPAETKPTEKDGKVTVDENGRYHDSQGRLMAKPTARRESIDSTQTNGDTPPADPKKRDEWAMNRFKKRAAPIFGNDN